MSKEQTDWVMVPREATEAMWRAAQQFHHGVWSHQVEAMWRAMLAAAPVPADSRAVATWGDSGPVPGHHSGDEFDAAPASPSPAGGVQGVTEDMVEVAARVLVPIWYGGFEDQTQKPEGGWLHKPGTPNERARRTARAALTAALSSQAQTTGGVE